MTTAVGSRPRTSTTGSRPGGEAVADVFVIFGITGDLAKVMTFHSLYRLENRGLLNCPIIGVAVDAWTPDDLRSHARAAIEASGEQIDDGVFDRLIGRMSATSATPRRTSGSPARSAMRNARSSISRSHRSCSGA